MENCCAHCGFILNKPIHEGSTQLKQALIQTSCTSYCIFHMLQCNIILFILPSVADMIQELLTFVLSPLKNAIDWASRPPNVWADKAAAIVSAGGGFGGGRSQYHLRQIGVYLDLHFINKPEFFLNAFQPPAKFDGNGNLVDESFQEKLKEVLISLQAFTLRLQGKL
ncbi:NADPH:quinone oxidoreductase-like [Fagus crenata]